MIDATSPPEIFDRKRRQSLRQRAGRPNEEVFVWRSIADELADRLRDVRRTFGDVLIIGPMAAYADRILNGREALITTAALSEAERMDEADPVIEEDRLPFAPASFDLIISAGTLDSVNDLPGALVQLRRCLRPDGLFLGHMFGAGTLGQLKKLMMAADDMSVAAHIHPQIDLRTAADLLSRAGFALPVADSDTMSVRYSDWRRLIADLREMGVGNALAGARRYAGRGVIAHLEAAWQRIVDNDGKVEERFVHIHLSGWAPSESQPKPAKRGSGEISLASFLPAMRGLD